MVGKLKALRRRWLLWTRGECEWEGCTEPERGFPMYGGFCARHFDAYMRESWRKHKEAEFEHEVKVQAEALRRTLPAALQDSGSSNG